jgi:hypothetical protein
LRFNRILGLLRRRRVHSGCGRRFRKPQLPAAAAGAEQEAIAFGGGGGKLGFAAMAIPSPHTERQSVAIAWMLHWGHKNPGLRAFVLFAMAENVKRRQSTSAKLLWRFFDKKIDGEAIHRRIEGMPGNRVTHNKE